jgi:hypothetical protein
VDEGVDAPRAAVAEDLDLARRQVARRDHARAQGVVDVVVDVGDAIDEAHDRALQRRRLGGAARMADDPVADRFVEVEALDHVDDPQRVLEVAKARAEALAQAGVQGRLADMAEGRVAEVVAEPDRLDQVLVQAQRPRHGSRHLRDLEGVGEPCAVVVALGGDEHLRLVLEPAEGLGVDDPVAIALERGAQRAVLLRTLPERRVGAGGQVGQALVLPRPGPGLELRRDGGCDDRSLHAPIVAA